MVAEAGGAPGDVIALAVVQEETTFAGSRTSAFALEPDVAIAVDVTFATDQPGVELGPITKHTFGSGPVIARGSTLHPVISDLLYETGEQEEIPFTVESMGRTTGTDADAVHSSAAPASRPGSCRYQFATCTHRLSSSRSSDIDAAARLIAAFAQRLTPGMSFER